MLGDDPPYLSVGTEVSAKYKGAFCEAKIRKVVRSVKCRVTYKHGLGTNTVTDDQIKGVLRVGAIVEAKHNERKEFVEATISKIQDCSQYTVVFDDGDITTLRRSALCLKSGRHFAESETLDQLPLTHPEHFGNPVVGGRRGRRSRQIQDGSSDEDDDLGRGSNDSITGTLSQNSNDIEPEIGRVVCVEVADKKKKDNWFPGLVVAPTAQDTVRIRVRDDYLVRSFKDARYYTVPKNEALEFTKEIINKVENPGLKVAVEKALLFLEKNELPPHWDKDLLFGNSLSSGNSDTDGDLDSDTSDDEPREEKDHFVAQLYKFMDDRGTPINNCPMIGSKDIDLYRLFRCVYKVGGYNRVSNQNQWKLITKRLGLHLHSNACTQNLVKQAYKKFLHSFEDFYRKLGCTLLNHPRGSSRRPRLSRTLIRDKVRTTPTSMRAVVANFEKSEEEDKAEEEKLEKIDKKRECFPKHQDERKFKGRSDGQESCQGSCHDSDINVEGEESSSSEKSHTSSISTSLTSLINAGNQKPKIAKSIKEDLKKKKLDIKKIDLKKDEKSKLEDDVTKTRSKSKEDIKMVSKEYDKKTAKQRKIAEDELKKRGRKRKDQEGEKIKTYMETSSECNTLNYNGPVDVGDKLKVYYGPTHESKVTYEAKVIDKEDDGAECLYLVHYTGWNTRYDEWIKTSRIAQNFTQSQNKLKRSKAVCRPQTPNVASFVSTKTPKQLLGTQNRKRAQSVVPLSEDITHSVKLTSKKDEKHTDGEFSSVSRSVTSSPLNFNIIAKSPIGRSTRLSRNIVDPTLLQSTKRSKRVPNSNDSESDGSDSSYTDPTELEGPTKLKVKNLSKLKCRKKVENKTKMSEISEPEEDKSVDDLRRGKRYRKNLTMQDTKSEPDSDEGKPKGRDFDLNQIRSELKGFDKTIKLDISNLKNADVEDAVVPKEEPRECKNIEFKTAVTLVAQVPANNAEVAENKKLRTKSDLELNNMVDIYEFKEPEPFEFEIRNKRDLISEKDKQKRRVLDDIKTTKRSTKSSIDDVSNLKLEENTETDFVDSAITKKENAEDVSEKKLSQICQEGPSEQLEDAQNSFFNFVPELQKKLTFAEAENEISETMNNYDQGCKSQSCMSKEQLLFIKDSNSKNKQKCHRTDATFKVDNKILIKEEAKHKIKNISEEFKIGNFHEHQKSSLRLVSQDIEIKIPSGAFDKKIESKNLEENKKEIHFGTESKNISIKKQLLICSGENKAEMFSEIDDFNNTLTSVPKDASIEEIIEEDCRKEVQKDNYTNAVLESSVDSCFQNNTFPIVLKDIKRQLNTGSKLPANDKRKVVNERQKELSPSAVTNIFSNINPNLPCSNIPNASDPDVQRQCDSFSKKKSDLKPELKLHDSVCTSSHPPSLAPISSRLPATSSIEEKLSAAAVFRIRVKDPKKEDDNETKRLNKEISKRSDLPKRIKEDTKSKYECDKKKDTEFATYASVLSKTDIRKDPLLEMVQPNEVESIIKNELDIQFINKNVKYLKEDTSNNKDVSKNSFLFEETEKLKNIQKFASNDPKPSWITDSAQLASNNDHEKKIVCIHNQDHSVAKYINPANGDVTLKSCSCFSKTSKRWPIPKSNVPNCSNSADGSSSSNIYKLDEEKEANMDSLLCEEEIPGSPNPGLEVADQDDKKDIVRACSGSESDKHEAIETCLRDQITVLPIIVKSNDEVGSYFKLDSELANRHHSDNYKNMCLKEELQLQESSFLRANSIAKDISALTPFIDSTPPTTPGSTNSSNSDQSAKVAIHQLPNIDIHRDRKVVCPPKPQEFCEDHINKTEDTVLCRQSLKLPVKRSTEEVSCAKKTKKMRNENSLALDKSNSMHLNKVSRKHVNDSDSDDTSETFDELHIPARCKSPAAQSNEINSFLLVSSKLNKYSFFSEIDPKLNGTQKINTLQQKLTDLRKTYNSIKAELATIERRKKKLKRKEKEAVKLARVNVEQIFA